MNEIKVGKHTPGPWVVESSGLVKGNGGLNDVALPYTYRDEPALTEANARLLAAAPELLEALEVITGLLKEMDRDRKLSIGSSVWALMNNALIKARGES